jgi:hypothetical protein
MAIAPYSLATLLTPQGLADLRGQLLAFLQGQGFPAVTEWAPEPNGLEMSWVDMLCKAINDLAQSGAPVDQQIASAAAAHFLGYAKGGWLDILAWEVYRLLRGLATKTSFTLTLASVLTAPPYTFEVGDVRVVGPTGNQYQSVTAGDLEPGGQVEISFQAQDFGSTFDDDPSLVTMQLATSFAGVSVSNAVGDFTVVANSGGSTGILTPVRTDPAVLPAPRSYSIRIDTAGDPGTATYSLLDDTGQLVFQGLLKKANPLPGGTSVNAVAGVAPSYLAGDVFVFATPGSPDYVQGDDIETDAALSQRCRYRWQSLALNVLDAKAILWAVTAYPSINRAGVNPSRITPGNWIITVADSHGGVDVAGLGLIESYARARLGVGEGMSAAAAIDVAVIVGGNARVPLGTSAEGIQAIQKTANTAWVAYLATVSIGPSELFTSKLIQILLDAGCEDAGDVVAIGITPPTIPDGAVPVAANDLASGLLWMSA